MSEENETYYRLFHYSDEFGDENVTSAIFADMFVVPTYQIRFGNLTSWFAVSLFELYLQSLVTESINKSIH